MLLALIILPIVTVIELGGIDQTKTILMQVNPDFGSLWKGVTAMGFVSLMAWGLGYFGQPHILSRFMAIRSTKDIPASRNISMAWMVISLFGALAVGLVGAAYFADKPLENSETVFIFLSQAILNPWVAGVIIAAILSAIMSTIDSQLLVCSSVVVEDFYKNISKKPATESQLIWLTRFSLLAVAVLATLIALDPQSSVLGLVSYAWAGFGAAFGPAVILSLFWSKYTRSGAIATIVVGAIIVIVWKQLSGGIFDLYEIVPAFTAALIAGISVSLFASNEGDCEEIYNQLDAHVEKP